jgi:hypothetical protein
MNIRLLGSKVLGRLSVWADKQSPALSPILKGWVKVGNSIYHRLLGRDRVFFDSLQGDWRR